MKNYKNVYAAYAKDTELRLASSSGAIFSLLALQILNQMGVIYGVAMTSDCYGAEYKRVTNRDGLRYLRGSKYFQAKVGDTYKLVKQDLLEGKIVLFTGTGCYVNGLKTFLHKEYDNLYCMDIVCHGTPSPELWKKYVKYRENQNHSKMIYASFRNKDKHDWNGFEMKEIDEDHHEVWISRHIDPYFTMFVKNICLRPSCFSCTAKSLKLSDITVADFWGIDKVAPEMNDNLGISLVLTRSDKGQQLFDSIREFLVRKEVSYEDGVRDNKAEYQSYSKPKDRDKFFKDMNKLSFENLSHKYVDTPLWEKFTKKIKKIIKQLFIQIGIHKWTNANKSDIDSKAHGGVVISEHIYNQQENYGILLGFEKSNNEEMDKN